MIKKQLTEIFSKEFAAIIRKNGRFFRRGSLAKKELSVFEIFEIKKMGNELRFLILKMTDLSLIPVKHISRVVNTLHLLYGDDDNGKGKFSQRDIYELNNKDVDWNGRSWLQTEKYLQPVMIRCDDNEGLKLFVMNV
jgi:hypothetical protein